MKRRAVSLRQMSFLLQFSGVAECRASQYCSWGNLHYVNRRHFVRVNLTDIMSASVLARRIPRLCNLLCVWPALNPLSIHVTFTAIVPEAYIGEAKMNRNWRTFRWRLPFFL